MISLRWNAAQCEQDNKKVDDSSDAVSSESAEMENDTNEMV